MWSDESRCVLFQSDGHIRRSRQACEMMHTSCVVPATHKPGGSSAQWCGADAVAQVKVLRMLRPHEGWDQTTTWMCWMTRSSQEWRISSLQALSSCAWLLRTQFCPNLKNCLIKPWKDARDLSKQWKRNRNRLVTLKMDRTYLQLLQYI